MSQENVEIARRTSMAKYTSSERRLIAWAYPIGLRSPTVRRVLMALPMKSRLRREMLLTFAARMYEQFNQTGRIPKSPIAPNVEIEQTAALFDTAGTFRGHEGFDALLDELMAGFDQLRFVPQAAIELSPTRFLLLIRGTTVSGGLELDRIVGHLFDYERGFMTHLKVFWEEAEALEAVGLSE